MRTLRRAALLVTTIATSVSGQQKLASIGAGRSAGNDSAAYTFSFTFNRTDPVDADAGPKLWAGRTSRGLWFLTPSGEANIGNGTEVSADNVSASIELWFSGFVGNVASAKSLTQLRIAPTMTADKNFSTKLLYLPVGVQAVIYNNPEYPRLLLVPGLRFDVGHRTAAGANGNSFERAVGELSGSVTSASGWQASGKAKLFGVWNDEAVISTGAHGLADLSIGKRFVDADKTQKHMAELKKACTLACNPAYEPVLNPLGLNLRYQLGRDEPMYKKLNVVSLSVAWYAQ